LPSLACIENKREINIPLKLHTIHLIILYLTKSSMRIKEHHI
jgi:hypothetical protein